MARLFVYEEGTPIRFHLSEGRDAPRIMKLIQENGGEITGAADANFRLQFDAWSHTAMTLRSPIVNAEWIEACYREGTKLPIFRYQFNPSKLDMLGERNRNRAEIIKEELVDGPDERMYMSLHKRLPHLTSHQWRDLHVLHAESNNHIIEARRKLAASILAEIAAFQAEIAAFQAAAPVRLEEGTLSLIVENLYTGVPNEIPPQVVDLLTPEPTGTRHVSPVENTMDPHLTGAMRHPLPMAPPDERNNEGPNFMIPPSNNTLAEQDAPLPYAGGNVWPAYSRPWRTTPEDITNMARFAINEGLMKDNKIKVPTSAQMIKFMEQYDKEGKRNLGAWGCAWDREARETRLMQEIRRLLRARLEVDQMGNTLRDGERLTVDDRLSAQVSRGSFKRTTIPFRQEDVEAVARFLRAPGKECLQKNEPPSRKDWEEFVEKNKGMRHRSKDAWHSFYRKYQGIIIEAANKIPK